MGDDNDYNIQEDTHKRTMFRFPDVAPQNVS